MKNLLLYMIFWCVCSAEGKNQVFLDAAKKMTEQETIYDPSYFKIPYPMGDLPSNKGVCTDVIIRTYRAVGIDLQKEIHEDMKKNREHYPNLWSSSKKVDSNIDHRRVPNLQVFFKKYGKILSISDKGRDYKAGDIVTWYLQSNDSVPHIGIVSDRIDSVSANPLIYHNIGEGVKLENMLFKYKITGHYLYFPQ